MIKTAAFKYIVFCVLFITAAAFTFDKPWKESQLIEPKALADILEGPKSKHPVILNMGTMPPIKSAQMVGIGSTTHGMNKLKEVAATLDKKSEVVVYCGCCTMDNCPNVKPAMDYLTAQGFKNAKILNIKTDLNVDWTNKGYPMAN
ncbi:hypothetical protein RCC89_04035 [Cytophagaceae bacterium ABcell3]|nr:hypothetical protein RCC89_04035 [Cytophagaceae bacterium ABcell3]